MDEKQRERNKYHVNILLMKHINSIFVKYFLLNKEKSKIENKLVICEKWSWFDIVTNKLLNTDNSMRSFQQFHYYSYRFTSIYEWTLIVFCLCFDNFYVNSIEACPIFKIVVHFCDADKRKSDDYGSIFVGKVVFFCIVYKYNKNLYEPKGYINKNDVTIMSGFERTLHILECMTHIKSYDTRTYAHQT